jgi:hypothetical protein
MTLELLESLAKHLPTLTNPQQAAAGELIRLLAGGVPSTVRRAHEDSTPNTGLRSNHDQPNPDFVAKGRRLLPNWKDRVLKALETPTTRDDLCDALREAHQGCPPPFAVSYLLHNLWSQNLVELKLGPSERGRPKPLWCAISATSEPDSKAVPRASRKIEWTKEAVTDWVWEYLGQFPQYRHDRAAVKEAIIAAGFPELLKTGDKSKNVATTFGKEKLGTMFIKDRVRGIDDKDWCFRVVDEDGQPIKRDHNADIIP